jgi:hypothetical protein
MNTLKTLGFALVLGAVSACSFAARDPENYRNDTAALLASKNAEIATCYTDILKADKSAAGTVTVAFTVEKKTGSIVDAKVVPEKTTAPQAVQVCVTNAIAPLALKPPDRRPGLATFTWEFAATQTTAPAAPKG